MDSFAARVKSRRDELGLTQGQVAKASGLKQPDISKIERGDIKKTTELLGLARALECNPDWLDTGRGEKLLQGAKWVPLSNPNQLADALDLLADRINEIESLASRELIATRLQTLALSPDSQKARNSVLEALAWADAVQTDQEAKASGEQSKLQNSDSENPIPRFG